MSFDIIFQQNLSDVNVISKVITDISTATGSLKSATSILAPTVLFGGSLPTNINYMTIPTFNRKYFIDDIKSVRNGLFEISAHVDVLTTYANEIKALECIIARQQNDWNLYLDDGSFKAYQNRLITIKKFPSGFSVNQFVLGVAGD